ncbi:Prohormone-4, partial [Araneus ventricosus]
KRPPVEETANFLQALLANHGPNYLEKLFGAKARDALAPLGGVNKVAVALSGESIPLDFFYQLSTPAFLNTRRDVIQPRTFTTFL